ncbi:RNA polymerase sigma factor [Streptomyces sp. NPDC086077]|uniref:RNA polymerase sigma factor n=1 Tax=Streptomyces sp. NPDC086077 TaxID=3154862 RepID=UPI00344376DD
MAKGGDGGREPEEYDDELGEAVARAQRGDEAAFSTAYQLVQPPLLRFLRGMVGDDAEDVASEAWLEIARDLSRFRGDGAGFRAWTASIARHRALGHLRRLKSRPRATFLENDLADVPSPHDTASEAVEILSTERALALISALPRQQAEAILLQKVIGLDEPSAARVMGKRPGAVRSAVHRGLKRLAAQLAVPRSEHVTNSDSQPLGDAR